VKQLTSVLAFFIAGVSFSAIAGEQQQTELTPRVDARAYYECVDRETARGLKKDQAPTFCMKQLREKATAQAARDAPKLKAAQTAYANCLLTTAETIALASSESADLVREAVFVACLEERKGIIETHRPYEDNYEQVMQFADKRYAGYVLLEIIKARAAQSMKGRERENEAFPAIQALKQPL
jgi:ketosteroid isomerase-like protein